MGSDLIGYLENEINARNAFHTNATRFIQTHEERVLYVFKNVKTIMFNAIATVANYI